MSGRTDFQEDIRIDVHQQSHFRPTHASLIKDKGPKNHLVLLVS